MVFIVVRKERNPGFIHIMGKKNEEEISKSFRNIPDNLVKFISGSLDTIGPGKKLSSGETLLRMGKKIIPHNHELLSSENDSLRVL